MIISPTTHLLTLDEVAAELSVVRSTVWLWVKDEDLGAFKDGKVRRVSVEELTRFVLAHTVNPRRPGWMTEKVESEFQAKLREIAESAMDREFQKLRQELINERVAA